MIICSALLCSALRPAACLHVACVVQQKDARQWFAELSVDMDKVSRLVSHSIVVSVERVKFGRTR